MHLVVFEGSRWASFAPLSLSRPVFTLQCGLTTLLEKQIRHIAPTRLTLWVRPELEEYCRRYVLPDISIPTAINQPLDDEPALISSGRVLHLSKFTVPSDPCVAVDEGDVVRRAFTKSPGLSPLDCMNRTAAWTRLLALPRDTEQARLPEYIWDLIHWNEEAIVADAVQLTDRPKALPKGAYHVVAEQDIILREGASVAPGVVLDASKGPIVIDADASIGPNCVLQGPCYIGKHTSLSPLTYIQGGTSIGPVCKIGGEVANSVILGYTNKAHYGFLGHSYVGEWVNLGAGTTTSNLKNTYGPIKMQIGKHAIATDRRFLGSMIGDHTKSAIGTRLMTGSYIGACCLVAGSGLPPRFMPSFSFWTDEGTQTYRVEKAREVMRQVFSRRGLDWDGHYDEPLLQYMLKAREVAEES